ncbi:hypothetical protein [Thermus thermamylovorans]|uniref:Organic solvent tolerance-like N-terminal domain-containing protein n=1 Tax=Thermus thermamylovorans TaxID=2509362 RepID=A0A4Q9AXY6_9DEIN|nr:hypothetical protein [Thermus thermamylovorans]TBH16531.1 hypothetical protein ETP66_10260 [Thermus thermamylovorans]
MALAALLGVAAQEAFRPQVELLRGEKRVVASVSGEEGSLFYADYGDLLVGRLLALSPERVQVEEQAFFLDGGSVLEEGLELGQEVEAAFNPDYRREGLPYLLRLRRAGEGRAERYLRLVLYDPQGVEVRLGEGVEARGPLAVVERGGQEELLLLGGRARYLEEAGHLDLRPEAGEVWLQEGQVRVRGQRLRYRNDTGEAFLEGPLEVLREGERPLVGQAGALRYRLDEDRLWLLGGVEFRQGERVTRAARALVQEKEGYAYLFGEVESRDERGFVRGDRVRYALGTGEVVVLGRVAGEFREE